MKGLIKKIEAFCLIIRKRRFDLILYKLLKRLTGKPLFLPLPFYLLIEPTNFCNVHCIACPTGRNRLNRPARSMSLREFKKIVAEVNSYIAHIDLWYLGEPFLNKDILQMVKYATESGIRVRISTNGTFFNNIEYCKDVVKSGLDYLIICLDGADHEIYNKYRKGADFSTVIKGFELLYKAKQELKSRKPIVELQFIVTKHNEHQRQIMPEMSKKLHADVYSEKTVGVFFHDPDFQKLAEELIPRDTLLNRNCVKKNGLFVNEAAVPNSCNSIEHYMVINSNGDVTPCCNDPFSFHIMGNIFREDLKDIWRNEKYQNLRRKIYTDRKNLPVCGTCYEGRVGLLTKKT